MRFAFFLLPLVVTCWLSASAEQTKQSSDSVEKRFVFIPGTKWCGSGNRARHYHDLGRHRKTDKCCRTHDKCRYSIPAFTRKWGLMNPLPSTMSHCDCDYKFRACLKRVNNVAAKGVRAAYFLALGVKCFKFKIKTRRVCVKRNWWGWCLHRRNVNRKVAIFYIINFIS